MTLILPPSSRRTLLVGAGALAGTTLLGGRGMAQTARSSSDMIFTGGPILTMEDAQPTAEGVSSATTRTVVASSLVILGLDFVLTVFMFRGVA